MHYNLPQRTNDGVKQDVFSDYIPAIPPAKIVTYKVTVACNTWQFLWDHSELLIQMTPVLKKNLITEEAYSVISWHQKTGNEQESQGNNINF